VRLAPERRSTASSRCPRLGALAARLFTALRPNTRAGSRKNIASHYDLGNDFFERVLDPTLCYSSGVFPSESATLEEASVHKLSLLCDKLGLRPGDELVEIGTGWGGLALHAAERYGAKVVTTTISKEQHRYARARVERHGLSEQVSVRARLPRFRLVRQAVSVEMVEAIRPTSIELFERCGALLKPGGRMVLQSIAITGAYDRHLWRRISSSVTSFRAAPSLR
jgi:cyclopropane-fatty-acyl-phospholipid synthase